MAEVTGLDPAARRVTARRPLGEQAEFGYDWLILAAGVQQSYFGHAEYARFAPCMKTIADALALIPAVIREEVWLQSLWPSRASKRATRIAGAG
jgi:NADH dehydrogenase FAD-containing subunit